jgi:glutamine amidotransferase-like uncharacterized protein
MGGWFLGIIAGVQSFLVSELVPLAKFTAYIIVGDHRNLSFFLNTLNAMVGTILRFNFLSLNYTLTQSRFGDFC